VPERKNLANNNADVLVPHVIAATAARKYFSTGLFDLFLK
jgi:hypothetical protein